MSIHYLERQQINEQKWNHCIASNPLTESWFAYVGYLDIACDNWSALVLDDYVSVMPLPWRKKWGIHYVYPPFFLPRLGVFGKEIDANHLPLWIKAIPKVFKWIDIVLHEHQDVSAWNETKILHKTYNLPCNRSYQEIRKAYSQNHKRNCQKASAENWSISNEFPFEEAISLFKNNQAKQFKVAYKPADYKRLLLLLTYLQQQQQLESWGVFDDEGNMLASAFFPFLNGKYYFLFSGRNMEDQTNKAMFFLIDTFIREHAEQNISLDLTSNHPGIARFYAGFSANETSFYQLTISRLNFISQTLFTLYRKLR